LCITLTFTCHCSRCFLMLEQLYTDMNTNTAKHSRYEHMSASRCPKNVLYYKFHYRIILAFQTVLPFRKSVENTWKHSFFVAFNLLKFCKISVKGWAAQLKVKMATKLRKFSSIEISTLRSRILNNFTSFTRIC